MFVMNKCAMFGHRDCPTDIQDAAEGKKKTDSFESVFRSHCSIIGGERRKHLIIRSDVFFFAPRGIFLLVQKDTKDTQEERGENRFDPKNIYDVFRLCKTPLSPLDTSHPTKSAAPAEGAS